jgi:hypothetical protein
MQKKYSEPGNLRLFLKYEVPDARAIWFVSLLLVLHNVFPALQILYIRYHVYLGSLRVIYLVSTWDRMAARFAMLGAVSHAHGRRTPRGHR